MQSSCYTSPDKVIGIWDRIFSNGIPITNLDRDTYTEEGSVTRQRDGKISHGRWLEDSSSNVTLEFDGITTMWLGYRVMCLDGSNECIRLKNSYEDDWYHYADTNL